jgi:putative hydrolase of the HAD superfamily
VTGAAIFDLDGVVRVWDPEIIAGAERCAGLPPGVLAAVAFEPVLLDRVVTGTITDEAWRTEITATLEARFGSTARTAVEQWSEPVGAVDVEVLAIVREVRRARPVALLTNATSRLRSDLAALGLLGEFDRILNSSELALAKPDCRVFVRACELLDVELSACWFVDDSPGNVRAAATTGLRAHHFVGAPALRAWIDGQSVSSSCPAG